MLAAAALIDQALICLRSHPDEADARLRDALQLLQTYKTVTAPDEEPAPARKQAAKRKP